MDLVVQVCQFVQFFCYGMRGDDYCVGMFDCMVEYVLLLGDCVF